MIVLNAGVPRSGTVLVNAILRALFQANKIAIAQANPHGPELPNLVRRLQETGQDRHRTVLVHTHSWDAETARLVTRTPYVTAFVNYRDPRDVCVSLMRLHEHDFDTAAEMTAQAFQIFAATVRDLDPMVIPYEYLTADPEGHIFQIARRLGFWPGRAQIADIVDATSAERHRQVMEQVQSGAIDGLARRQNRNRVLVEDPKTLINDRHIQSGRAGRWRSDLTEDQQRVANERFADIVTRYGYPTA